VTYIGNVRDAHMMQDRMPRLCPEGVEDFGCTLLSQMPVPTIAGYATKLANKRIRELEALLRASEAALALAASRVAELSPKPAQPAPDAGIRHGLAAWPGVGGIDQFTGKPRWVVWHRCR
jgi:hypothetical protein